MENSQSFKKVALLFASMLPLMMGATVTESKKTCWEAAPATCAGCGDMSQVCQLVKIGAKHCVKDGSHQVTCADGRQRTCKKVKATGECPE